MFDWFSPASAGLRSVIQDSDRCLRQTSQSWMAACWSSGGGVTLVVGISLVEYVEFVQAAVCILLIDCSEYALFLKYLISNLFPLVFSGNWEAAELSPEQSWCMPNPVWKQLAGDQARRSLRVLPFQAVNIPDCWLCMGGCSNRWFRYPELAERELCYGKELSS